MTPCCPHTPSVRLVDSVHTLAVMCDACYASLRKRVIAWRLSRRFHSRASTFVEK